jgi:sirohydrochlorin cobaltochelatase
MTQGKATQEPAAGETGTSGTGLVLFAHGARDPRWAHTVEALAARVAALAPGMPVEPGYLELMEPDLAEAVRRLVEQGAREIVVVPVFLSAGGHVLRDLPAQLAALAPRHPAVSFRVEPALGSLPEVLDAMAAACVSRTKIRLHGDPPVR